MYACTRKFTVNTSHSSIVKPNCCLCTHLAASWGYLSSDRTMEHSLVIMASKVCASVQDLVQHCGIKEACLNAEVTPECFHDISRYLSRWKLLAPKLKLSSADIEDIEKDNRKAEEQRVSFLDKWKQKRSYEATYRALVESLLSIQRMEDARGVCCVLKGMPTITQGQDKLT